MRLLLPYLAGLFIFMVIGGALWCNQADVAKRGLGTALDYDGEVIPLIILACLLWPLTLIAVLIGFVPFALGGGITYMIERGRARRGL